MLKIINKLRRETNKIIHKDYLKNKLEKRTGECKKCGDCCRGCKYLKNNLCSIYNKRPWFCHKDFPIDELDQKIFNVKKCGYRFEK